MHSVSHPRAGSVTCERGTIPPLARENVRITGMSQWEQSSLSPGTGLSGSPHPLEAASFFFFFLLSAVYARVCRRRKATARNKNGGIRCHGLFRRSQGTFPMLQKAQLLTVVFLLCTALPSKYSENPSPFKSPAFFFFFLTSCGSLWVTERRRNVRMCQ